jgi:hypothetical protein
MKNGRLFFYGLLAFVSTTALGTSVGALTGVQSGPSGETYASATIQCGLNPVTGMAPMVHAGLYNPRRNASGMVLLNGAPVGTVTFLSPDTTVWLANAANTVVVQLKSKTADAYSFDASLASPAQINICIPDTSGNTVNGNLEYAASGKSYTTVSPGCAWNSLAGQPQPYVNLFDNGPFLLNISVNNVPLMQLNGTTRPHSPVFLSAGWNVISAANGSVSTDYYVRNGGTGSCTLP